MTRNEPFDLNGLLAGVTDEIRHDEIPVSMPLSRARLSDHDGFRVAAEAFRRAVAHGANAEVERALFALVQDEAAKAEAVLA
jgi:hypothetical protein